jgi:tetratricopeptide (TPR) repeat protein
MKKLTLILFSLILFGCTSDSPKALALLNEGDVLYKSGDYTEALSKFKQARSLDPELGSLDYNTGCVYFSLEDYDSAVFFFDHAIKHEPSEPEAYFFKAHALVNQEKPADALKALSIGLDIDSTQAAAYYVKGMALFQLELYPEAIASHTKAISIDPSSIDFYIARCAAYSMVRDYDSAMKDAEKVSDVDRREGEMLKAMIRNDLEEMKADSL